MGIVDLLLRPLVRSKATVGYPREPAESVRNRRTPRFVPESCTDDRSCLVICPTGAIMVTPDGDGARWWAVDYGRCVFCAECIRVCPSHAIAGTGEFELATASRSGVVAKFLLEGDRR